MDIDFALHGDSEPRPAGWTCGFGSATGIIAMGPRGHVTLAQGVDTHLFLGDETCIPAIAAMAARLKPSARAVALIEVKRRGGRTTGRITPPIT